MNIVSVLSSAAVLAALTSCSLFGPARVGPYGREADDGPRQTVPEAEDVIASNAQSAREEYRQMTFEEFKLAAWREPDYAGGKYIVSGDRPILNEKLLLEFYENEVLEDPAPRVLQNVALLAATDSAGGQDELWNSTMQRQLSYCVSLDFDDRYEEVVGAMIAAAEAWEAAADIDFIYNPGEDGDCTATNPDIVFDVRPVDVNGNYLARAFFPNDPRSARNVLIDQSSFDLSGNLTLIGILRHELGHALGFRHEHTRPEAGACFEDDNWRPVTDYDPFSVMHYPQCNGQGDWSLTLTDLDEHGAACVYGPAPGFTFDPAVELEGCKTVVPSACGPTTVVKKGSVARHQEIPFGPFAVAAGTTFEVLMSGTGDPDLYVRFGAPPTLTTYACRPYLSGATESCELDVPAGANEAFVMIRGYSAGTYTLAVTHTGGTP